MLKKLGSQVQKGRRTRTLGLLSCLGALAAFGLWQNSRRGLETAPVPPSSTVATLNQPIQSSAVSTARTGAPPEAGRSVKPHSVALRISVDAKFSGANLTVWVDDHSVLRRKLEGASKKKFGLFGHAGAKQSESVYITPGEHQIRVNVRSATDAYDESHSLRGTFPEGSERVLTVTFSEDNEMKVRLK